MAIKAEVARKDARKLPGEDLAANAEDQLTAVPRIGDALVEGGVATRPQVEQALALQRDKGGQLGPLVARVVGIPQSEVDRCLLQRAISPAADALLDQLSEGMWSTLDGRVEVQQLRRERTVSEDLLNVGNFIESTPRLRGFAVAVVGEAKSITFEFTLGPAGGEVDTLCARGLRRWIMLQARTSGSSAASP
ncbi:MAG: hypothetical protein GY842_28245 [bacterium]|nr:hypothetical protein [bacterium]